MTFMQLVYFVEVTESGSMSRAADHLFVSQPALSSQIKRLERELGYDLFYREPQGVSLTEAGRILYADAKRVMESWQQLHEHAKNVKNTFSQHICIGVGPRAFSNGLFEAVAAFFSAHPETEVTFLSDISGNILEALEQKKVFFAIDELPPPSMNPHPERFFVTELLHERQCILLSPDDPRAAYPELSFQSLQGESLISGPEKSLDGETMRLICEKQGVHGSRILRADTVEAFMSLIRSGKGVALGPKSFAKRYGVAAVPMLPEMKAAVNLICLRQNRQNLLVMQIKQHLIRYINNEAGI